MPLMSTVFTVVTHIPGFSNSISLL